MATRNRTTAKITNQENLKNVKSSVVAVPGKMKRAVLGEIGNRVNTLRGVEPIDKSSLLQKDKKKTTTLPKRQVAKPTEKAEKPTIQAVKPVAKVTASNEANVPNGDHISTNIVCQREEETNEAFSTNLLKFEDIDEEDSENPLLVSTYTNDIHQYLRALEDKFPIRKGYLTGQNVTAKMRSILIDWLIEVHEQFRQMQETLYLTVTIIDRFLQSYRTIDRKRLQLVGVTAMFIASKYEEMHSPDISDFVYITDQAYAKSDVLQMEMLIVKTVDYSFGRPLPLHFLRRYSKAGKALPIHHTLAKYILELSLFHYEMCHYRPSLIAAAALYLAFLIIGNDEEGKNKVIWTNTLAHYSTYSNDDVLPVVRKLAAILIGAEESKYQAARKKYGQAKHMKVSVRPELKSPTLLAIATMSNET